MTNISFLKQVLKPGTYAYKLCDIDLFSASGVEICSRRNDELSLGVYFNSYNIISLKLFTKLLILGGVSNSLQQIILKYFKQASDESGLNIDNGIVKVYQGNLVNNTYIATGFDYDIITEKLVRKKVYKLSTDKTHYNIFEQTVNSSLSIIDKSYIITNPIVLKNVYDLIKKENLSFGPIYRRGNGQEYVNFLF